MSNIIETFNKTHVTIEGITTVRYELHKYSTHFAIKAWWTNKEHPIVNTGKEKYIRKLWQNFKTN